MVGYVDMRCPLANPGDGPCVVREAGEIRYVCPDMPTAVEALDPFQPVNLVGDDNDRAIRLLFDR